MKPFDAGATCPKCGHDEVGTNYCRAKAVVSEFGGCPAYWHRPAGKLGIAEHLDRLCRRCHYGWVEACIEPAAAGTPGPGGATGGGED